MNLVSNLIVSCLFLMLKLVIVLQCIQVSLVKWEQISHPKKNILGVNKKLIFNLIMIFQLILIMIKHTETTVTPQIIFSTKASLQFTYMCIVCWLLLSSSQTILHFMLLWTGSLNTEATKFPLSIPKFGLMVLSKVGNWAQILEKPYFFRSLFSQFFPNQFMYEHFSSPYKHYH